MLGPNPCRGLANRCSEPLLFALLAIATTGLTPSGSSRRAHRRRMLPTRRQLAGQCWAPTPAGGLRTAARTPALRAARPSTTGLTPSGSSRRANRCRMLPIRQQLAGQCWAPTPAGVLRTPALRAALCPDPCRGLANPSSPRRPLPSVTPLDPCPSVPAPDCCRRLGDPCPPRWPLPPLCFPV